MRLKYLPKIRIARAFTTSISDPQISTYNIPKPIYANESILTKQKRLIWMSRKRGILETDLLLSTFAAKYIHTLTDSELDRYDELLGENDWDIYYWATGAKEAAEGWKGCGLLEKVVEHSKNKNKGILRMPELNGSI